MKTNINIIVMLANFLGSFFRKYFNTTLKDLINKDYDLQERINKLTDEYAPKVKEFQDFMPAFQNFINSDDCIIWLQKLIDELDLEMQVTRYAVDELLDEHWGTYSYNYKTFTNEKNS